MKKIQATCGTALAYCFAHRFMDKDPQMRDVWGWFALGIGAMMILIAIPYRKKVSDRQQPGAPS
jgi:hypothetical protein